MTKKSANGRHEIKLSFSQIECRCGAVRIRASPCPDCGRSAEPFEADVDNQRRRRIVDRCLLALGLENAIPPVNGELEGHERVEQFRVLAELPSRFFDAMQSLEKAGSGSPDDLVDACSAARLLSDRLSAGTRRRPWIRTDDVACASADALVVVMRTFLKAFAAPTPILAEIKASTAQFDLDAMYVKIDQLNALRERWESIEKAEDVGEWMAEVFADAARARGTVNYVDLDLAGRELYREITGRMPGDGAGLGLLASELFTQYIGDEKAFRGAIASADLFMATASDKLADLVSRPVVAGEMRNGFVQLADQLQLTNAAIASTLNERQTVRSTLDLMHTVFEGPARRMVALMLDLAGVGRFEEYLPADGARTIGEARDLPALDPVVYGFDAALRIAQAHQSYEFKDDHLILRMRKKGNPQGQIVRVSLDDLLDRALASVECVNALALVIQVHAAEQGLDVIGDETLAALNVGPAELGSMLLRAAGYGELQFTGSRVSMSGPKLTGAAAIAISLALPHDQIAIVAVKTLDVHRTYEIDIALMRENSSIPDGLAKEFHMQRVLSRVLVDREPGWPSESMQRWVVGRALEVVNSKNSLRDDFAQIMGEMRQLLNFSKDQGLPVADEIRGLMRFLRLSIEGRSADLDGAVFDRLSTFLDDDTPVVLPFEFDGE
ncbi:hypothetical protein [Aeromicrobium wangtongii]|uniref:Uncharacterized protein n=1 Tax=Aeromicrobium wangtongii TaxID=2969247 RepID=A0ABY5MEE3_9ACTN|nr:hypothetical protein [Aeromicrobium wangtongii]MCD9197802.1 hypothetical protein [Aeromicrobium wangtongii]UUP15284.1 hypothetical protein NQV15_08225 [Aeromicrobium wangtongii]